MATKVKRNNKKPGKTPATTAEPQNLVVQQLVIRTPQRKTSDVGQWRKAMQAADYGRFIQLYNLYDDLLIDGVLSRAVEKRIEAITNAELTFQNAAGEDVEEITALMDTPSWEEVLTTIMQKRFWGRSGMEFSFTNGFHCEPIPVKHINIDKQEILLNETDDKGISYANDDHIVILGKKRDFGLFLKTAPFAIWKRGGFGDYAQWLEIFGMPQRVGKYSSYDPESRKLLEDALDKAGSAPWVVIPKESEVETVQNTGNGSSGSSYNDFRKACNEEMLITVVGQTMTSVQGDKGARSLGDVHKEVEEGINQADMRFVQRVLNYHILPLLEKRGYPVTGGKFIFPQAAEPLTVDEIVSLSEIIEIPAAWLHNKYSIPIPKDGEQIARRSAPASAGAGLVPAQNTDDPNADPIQNADRNFFIRLFDFFAQAPAQIGALNGVHPTGQNNIALASSTPPHFGEGTGVGPDDQLIARIFGGKSPAFDPELFTRISSDLISALTIPANSVQLADTAVAYGYNSDAWRTAQELNVFHFSASKTLAELQKLNELYRSSKSFEEFYKKAKDVTDVFNKEWQKTEYQTATLIASATENYNRLKGKVKLFPYWEYKTLGDDKVRPEHRKLNGIILPANDPLWDKIFPPNGWKCRCYIVPRMAHEVKGVDFSAMRKKVSEYFATIEWKTNKAQGFGVNRALTPEIFTENQMYIGKFPNQGGKLLKDVNYQSYKLGSYEQNRAKSTEEFIPYQGSSTDFFDKLTKEDGKVFFTDYNDRSVLFDEKKYLKGHSDKKYQERTKYIQAAAGALKTPDEVWINDFEGKTMNQYVFIKYYIDKTIAVVAEIADGNIYRIRTWFPITENKFTKLKYRYGLLIKTNPVK